MQHCSKLTTRLVLFCWYNYIITIYHHYHQTGNFRLCVCLVRDKLVYVLRHSYAIHFFRLLLWLLLLSSSSSSLSLSSLSLSLSLLLSLLLSSHRYRYHSHYHHYHYYHNRHNYYYHISLMRYVGAHIPLLIKYLAILYALSSMGVVHDEYFVRCLHSPAMNQHAECIQILMALVYIYICADEFGQQ